MDPRITNIIGLSNFEKVRDLIASYLVTEFEEQRVLNQAALDAELLKPEQDRNQVLIDLYTLNLEVLPSKVWVERFRRPEAQEVQDTPLINVILVNVPLDQLSNVSSQTGVNRYLIEVHTGSREEDSLDPSYLSDSKAYIKLQRILAIVRNIIMFSGYRFLELEDNSANYIGSVQAEGIAFEQPDYGAMPGSSSIRGKIDVNVKMREDNIIETGEEITTSATNLKLFDTEKGYYFETIKLN
jgi:hypothetical protein